MAVTNKKLFGKYGFDANNSAISNVADPTSEQDVATKAYSTNASNLATGTVSTARLASGSATSSTFLRGDSTWVSLPATTSVTGTSEQILANGTFNSAQSGTVTLTLPSTVSLTDLNISGNLTVNGTTTNLNSTNLVIEDKNIILGDATTPTNTTADGGGLTLKGTTDKTFNWVSATNAWTSSEHVSVSSGKNILLNGSTSGTITLSPAATSGTNTITLPATTGTVVTTGDTGTVTSTMIADGTIVDADINASAAIVDTKLATISTSGKVSNSATTADSANTASAIVARDGSGNFAAGTITASLAGNASSVTNGIYTTDTATVTNTMLAGSIADTKLNTISTAGKVSNSATTATSANTASAIVARDASGNFTAGTITGDLTGNASTATTATTATNATNVAITNDTTTSSYVYPTWVGTSSGNQAVKTTDSRLKFKPSTGELVTAEETKVSKSLSVNNSTGAVTTIDTFTGGAAEYLIAVYQLTNSGGAEARAVVKLLMSVTGKPTVYDLNYIEMGESQSFITFAASVNANSGLTTLTAIGVNGAGYSYNVVFTRTSLSLTTA
jgi:hypothetical protein